MKPRYATEHDKRIGANIKALRVTRGLTIPEIVGKLGITHQQLYKYETGVNRISASRIHDLAAILKCTVSDLMDDETILMDSATARRLKSIMELIAKQPDKKQTAILKFLRACDE